MSAIDPTFIQALARVWHGIALDDADAATLAAMLAAMDDAAEREAARLAFESEPAGYLQTAGRRTTA